MRMVRVLLLASVASLSSTAAFAADTVKQGPPPAWVHPQALPTPKASDAPVQLLLEDTQIKLEPGKVTSYSDGALKIQNSQGLAAGNLSIVWQPETETVTVNKLHIIRDGKVIDVLAGGQTFTVLRRETNLDAATLDGTLTATIQPEGIQEGDILELATTTERSDPVMKGHVEAAFAPWGGLPIAFAHASVQWPTSLHLNVRETPNLPTAQRSVANGMNRFELTAQNVEPLVPPKSAPERFTIGRLAEATDYNSWADIADLMMPLFRTASTIPATGSLHDEVEKIRAATPDPLARATQALALVQDRVRYVALLMGQGGYVPAAAEQTWSRRFGDCKGKTALLLGILHSLGIQAEPVLAQTKLGDMIADRLPMMVLFNHVLVRAHIGGKDYWLDGTRTGDTDLNAIETPDFGWGLPLVEHAALVHMVPAPLTQPRLERLVSVDASAGIFAPATISIQETTRGDGAVEINTLYSAATSQQRDEAMHDTAKGYFDGFNVTSSSYQFDKAKRSFTVTIKGTAKLNWKDGWYYVPNSSLAYDPDFDRTAGPLQDVPIAIGYPTFVKDHTVVTLPADMAASQKLSAPVHEILVGVDYQRTETVNGNMVTVDSSERSIVPEVPYKDAVAAEAQLRTLDKDDVYLNAPASYRGTDADLATLVGSTPSSAMDYFVRAGVYASHNKTTEALADLNAGLALDPKNSWALEKRASINLQKQHFGDVEKDLKAAGIEAPNDPNVMASRGQLALSKGDINGAAAAFDQAFAMNPKNTMALYGQAKVLMARGKTDQAVHKLGSLLSEDPKNVDALALRAQILTGRNDDAGAERDIKAALAIDPENAWALAIRAGIAVERKDYATAKEFVGRSLARDPNQPYARGIQAELLKRDGATGSTASFDAAVAASPRDPAPLVNRAVAYIEAKNFDAAAKDLNAALVLDPGNMRALGVESALASEKGDFAGAIKILTAMLAASPGNGPVLTARAEAYRELHQFDLALADTEAAMKAGLVSPDLRLLRINILMSKGDVDNAAVEADQLVKENPTSEFAMVAAGKTYSALGLQSKAMAALDRAIAINPVSYIYINRAQIRPHEDIAGKIADLDQALKIEPGQEDALAEKAKLLSRAGKNAEAIALYDTAIKGALDSSQLELLRAVALQRAGRVKEAAVVFDAQRAKAKTAGDFDRLCYTKAINDVLLESALQDCRRAAQIDANYPNLNEFLGLVLLKLGKFPEALAAYDKAIATKSGAESYLGRAIVHQRMGDLADAQSDAAKARHMLPDIDDLAYEYGLKLDVPMPAKPVIAKAGG